MTLCAARRFPEWSLWALDKRRAGLLTDTFWSDGHPDATSVSDRLLLGLPRAPLQRRLKLGIAQLVDRFPSRDAPRADPVVREGFAQPLSGEFALLLRGSTAPKACLGRPLEYLVHPMPLPGLGALPVLPGGDKLAILGQPLPEPSLPFGPQQGKSAQLVGRYHRHPSLQRGSNSALQRGVDPVCD